MRTGLYMTRTSFTRLFSMSVVCLLCLLVARTSVARATFPSQSNGSGSVYFDFLAGNTWVAEDLQLDSLTGTYTFYSEAQATLLCVAHGPTSMSESGGVTYTQPFTRDTPGHLKWKTSVATTAETESAGQTAGGNAKGYYDAGLIRISASCQSAAESSGSEVWDYDSNWMNADVDPIDDVFFAKVEITAYASHLD